jgi:hypothetical protein
MFIWSPFLRECDKISQPYKEQVEYNLVYFDLYVFRKGMGGFYTEW